LPTEKKRFGADAIEGSLLRMRWRTASVKWPLGIGKCSRPGDGPWRR